LKKFKFQLPAAEDDLWHQVVKRLLEQRDVDEKQAKNHLQLLEELAFHHRFCGKPLTRAFAEDTASWLAEKMKFGVPRYKAGKWLKDLEQWELLRPAGDENDASTYEFSIPTLDEYFAARHLAARWAEEDKSYTTWLPFIEVAREGTREFQCPNHNCQARLLSFRELLHQTDYEESVLLLQGLLNDADREARLLWKIENLNLLLKARGRCRHSHPNMAEEARRTIVIFVGQHFADLKSSPATGLFQMITPVLLFEPGLATLGRARNYANLKPILQDSLFHLNDDHQLVRMQVSNILSILGAHALSTALNDETQGFAGQPVWHRDN